MTDDLYPSNLDANSLDASSSYEYSPYANSLYAISEQLIDPEGSRASAVRTAIITSLILHLGMVGCIFLSRTNTSPAQLRQLDTAMVVSIARTNPQLRQQSVTVGSTVEVENSIPEPAQNQQAETSDPSREQPATPQPDTVQQKTSEQAAADLAESDVIDAPSELPDDDTKGTIVDPDISAARINNAVNTYIVNYKSSLTSDWLSACIKYQNEHGVDFCPPSAEGKSETARSVGAATEQLFRTYVTSETDKARVSKQLLEEMTVARQHMDENSILGELSRQRYELALANYCLLNECRGISLDTKASFDTPVSNEGSITIFEVGDTPSDRPVLKVDEFLFEDQ
ncbi:MAG: cell envelope integrity protein TolA [Pseudomonadota bacterium]